MTRFLLGALTVLLAASVAGCSGSESVTSNTTTAATTTVVPSTVAPTTTAAVTTTTAPPTTLAPSGSVRNCGGFLTFVDEDGDGWCECVVTIETGQQQYFVISGKYNGATANLNTNRRTDCETYLGAIQTFGADLLAAQWPTEVQPQIDELIAAIDYELFLRDENCRYSSNADQDAADLRLGTAVFEARKALGLPTDF